VELLNGIAAVRTAQVAGSTVAIVQMCRLSCREPICGSNLYYVGRRNQSKWGVWGGLTGLNLVGRRGQFARPGRGGHIGVMDSPKGVLAAVGPGRLLGGGGMNPPGVYLGGLAPFWGYFRGPGLFRPPFLFLYIVYPPQGKGRPRR